MKRKFLHFLSLLLLMLCSTSAWAETETLLTYKNGSSAPSAKTDIAAGNGIIQAGNAWTPDESVSGSYGWKIDGDPTDAKATSKYVLLKLAEGVTFKAGDVITISGYSASTPSETAPQGFTLYDGIGGSTLVKYGHAVVTGGKKTELFNATYTIATGDDLIGKDNVIVSRYFPTDPAITKGSSSFFVGVTITRPSGSSDTPTVTGVAVTGIKVNGNKADVTCSDNTYVLAETLLPPTVALVKTTTYSNNTTADADVAVTLALNEDKSFYIGTATIGETEYTVKVPVKALSTTLADVTTSTTWDWTKTGASAIQLTDATYPSKLDEFVLSNVIAKNDDFNSDALKVQTEYAVRDGKYFQGGKIMFHTTVPGTIKVSFSNTGDRKGDETLTRYLHVNGEKTAFGSNNGTVLTTDEIDVEAGDVVLTSKMPSSENDQYIRVYSIVFTEKTVEPEPEPESTWKDVKLVLCGDNSFIREVTTEEWAVVNTGIAIAEDGTASAVAVDAANSVATLTGKYHSSQWGMSNPVLTIPVEGPVRISLGSSYYAGTATISKDGAELATIETNVGENAHLWSPSDNSVVTYEYTGDAATLTIACNCYEPYIAVEAIEVTPGGDDDYELKERVVYNTKFQDWTKASADATNGVTVTQTTTDGQELVFKLIDTAVDPEGTNTKFSNDCVTVGYLQTNKSAIATITTSPLESITKLEVVQAATGGTRGITLHVKGDGDADWVEIHNASIVNANGETLTFDINRTNCQLKFGNFAPTQNAYITSLKISGNVKVAKRTFQDFKVDFRIKNGEQAYTVVTPADGLPEGVTVNPGSYNGGQHGATNPSVTVKVDGPVKFTIGSCQYGAHTVTVTDANNTTLATIDNNNGCENGYSTIEECTYNNYVVYTYNNETPATLTFNVNGYCPFFIAEACDYIPEVTVSYYGLDGKLIGEKVIDGGSDLTFAYGEADLTIPAGKAFRGWFDGSSINAQKVNEGISVTADTKLYAKATDIEVATVGSVWNYDLTKKNFYQEDHELINLINAKYYNNHGWQFSNGVIEIPVAGKAVVNFSLCMYSGDSNTITLRETDESINAKVAADGASASFSYDGEATTLHFDINGGYVHNIKVFNVNEIPTKNAAGYYVLNSGDAAGLILTLATAQSGDKIFLPNGLYDFGATCLTAVPAGVSIIGQSQNDVIVKNTPLEEGIGVTATLMPGGDNYMQDFSIQCSSEKCASPAASRCVTIQDKATRNIFKNVSLLSGQDTYYSNGNEKQQGYFEDCYITGTVDYICGGGDIVFKNTTFYNNKRDGGDVIVAPATNANTKWGYVMMDCIIDGDSGQEGKFNIGRDWQGSPAATWLNTTFKIMPTADGYTKMSNSALVLRFHEFNSHKENGTEITGHNFNALVGGSTYNDQLYLTVDQADKYTLANIFADGVYTGISAWNPAADTEQAVVDNDNIEEDETYLIENAGNFVAIIKGSEFSNVTYRGMTIRKANARGGFGESIVISESTGICDRNVITNMSNAPIYNIAGQRVAAGTKGILIQNGVKMIVK